MRAIVCVDRVKVQHSHFVLQLVILDSWSLIRLHVFCLQFDRAAMAFSTPKQLLYTIASEKRFPIGNFIAMTKPDDSF